jgi:hypothetical protein
VKDLQARCVLISDASQACNGTVISSAAAKNLLSSPTDVVAECHTGGSIRLALIAVLGFIIIPVPFLLRYVDGAAGHVQALSYARKHGASAPKSPVESIGSGDCVEVRRVGVAETETAHESPEFEMTIHRPDMSAAAAATSPPVQ